MIFWSGNVFTILRCFPVDIVHSNMRWKRRVVYVRELHVRYRAQLSHSRNSSPCRKAPQNSTRYILLLTHELCDKCYTRQQLSCHGFESDWNSFVSCGSYFDGNLEPKTYNRLQKYRAGNFIIYWTFHYNLSTFSFSFVLFVIYYLLLVFLFLVVPLSPSLFHAWTTLQFSLLLSFNFNYILL